MPVTTPSAPRPSCSQPASSPSSANEPASSSRSTRSRTGSFPCDLRLLAVALGTAGEGPRRPRSSSGSPRSSRRSRDPHSTGPASSTWLPSGRPSTSCAAREASISAPRSTPVEIPISWSIETRSSVAMLPVAPAGTGQPPSSPKLDSKLSTPASSAASTLASPWPRVLWKCAVSSTPGSALERSREELPHLDRIGHARRVAEPDLRAAGIGERARDLAARARPARGPRTGSRTRSRSRPRTAVPRTAPARTSAPAPPATPRPSGRRSSRCGSRRPTGSR